MGKDRHIACARLTDVWSGPRAVSPLSCRKKTREPSKVSEVSILPFTHSKTVQIMLTSTIEFISFFWPGPNDLSFFSAFFKWSIVHQLPSFLTSPQQNFVLGIAILGSDSVECVLLQLSTLTKMGFSFINISNTDVDERWRLLQESCAELRGGHYNLWKSDMDIDTKTVATVDLYGTLIQLIYAEDGLSFMPQEKVSSFEMGHTDA